MPYNVSRKTAILAATLLSLFISSCALKTDVTKTACETDNVSINCIFERAEEALNTIGSDVKTKFDYASSAAELAIAYDSVGQTNRANELLGEAVKRSSDISDDKKRTAAIGEVLTALSQMSPQADYQNHIETLSTMTLQLPEMSQRADMSAKSILAIAVQGDMDAAFRAALKLPQNESYEANYKAITLRKIAGILASKGDFETANEAIKSITMSIPYYQSVVRSDVAFYAARNGREIAAQELLNQATEISLSQENGYFSGAGLRDIGYVYAKMNDAVMAKRYFKQAIEKAATAPKPNERARAVSRVATKICDLGTAGQSAEILTKAHELAEDIPKGVMLGYSAYEMTGSAAFCGHVTLARDILKTVPDTALGVTESLQSAAKRDLVWGLGRHGKVEEALDVVATIKKSREKIHAYSRLIRVITKPEMKALPRYL